MGQLRDSFCASCESWTVEEFSGRLSGDTTLKLTGQLGRAAGWPAFEGTLSMASPRLGAPSLLWKRAGEGNPLFGMGGSLNGRVQLVNDRLRFIDGLLVLDETVHTVSGDMRFGDAPSLEVTAGLSALNARQSTGRGQHIDVALFDSQLAWLINQGTAYLTQLPQSMEDGLNRMSFVLYEFS